MADSAREPSIQVLGRAFALLDVLATYNVPVSLKTLASEAALHPSTTHRILADLVRGGYVERAEPGTYQLGLRLLELGGRVRTRLEVREVAAAPMRKLHQLTGQPVSLSVRQGDEIVYVERVYSERSGMQVVRAVGTRAPLHLTSVGKLFLAAENADATRAYAERTRLPAHTPASIRSLSALQAALAQVRASGVARDDEEHERGVRCVAAAIRDDQQQVVAGLSISAPAAQMQPSWSSDVRRTADDISAALGAVRR